MSLINLSYRLLKLPNRQHREFAKSSAETELHIEIILIYFDYKLCSVLDICNYNQYIVALSCVVHYNAKNFIYGFQFIRY